MLQLNAVPETLPCREKECSQIRDYLEKENRSCLYISGMPGTGKTSTVLEVIKSLQPVLNFNFLHINAINLRSPMQLYQLLFKWITGRETNCTMAALFLEDFFKLKDKPRAFKQHKLSTKFFVSKRRVLLVDELDALLTRKQSLMYNLFNWPTYTNSQL